MSTQGAYPAAGEVIDGKYQIEKMLGEGGMGAVAKAVHLLRRAPVALKFMSPNVMSFPGAVERFLNEGVAASQIDSDHVVHIFDVGKLPTGAPYLVMEYMEGQDLAELLARDGQGGGIEIARAIHFTLQTLRGLQVAHDAGIIHRDMKPSNCFVVNKEGEADFVKLLDFGISKVGQGKSASLTQTNSALGTPLYMSPEQAKSPRDVDLRSDLYSVGVILYELLTAKTPFSSESGEFTEILFKLFTQDPPPIRSFRPELSPELAAVVHRALVRDPNDRYATAQDFGAALGPFADARSARVLQRLKTHVTGRASALPSGSGPGAAPVAAAFSKLAMGQTPAGQQTPARHSAYPAAPGSRAANAAEAVAATQYGPDTGSGAGTPQTHAQQAGKQTDLGAARDTSIANALPAPEKKTSPAMFAIPALLVIAVAGVGVWKATSKNGSGGGDPPQAAAGLVAPTVATPDTPPPPPPPSAPVVPEPMLSASAAPSASAPPPVVKHGGNAASSTSTGAKSGGVHLKDLKAVE